jgi:uncharacterized membrane protein
MVGIMLMELSYQPGRLFLAFIVGLIAYIAMWAMQLLFNIFYLYSKKDKAILTEHIIEIQDEALYEETKYNKSFFYWNGIVKIVIRAGFVVIYVTKHMAHIIPARAFDSENQKNEFIKTVKEKLST